MFPNASSFKPELKGEQPEQGATSPEPSKPAEPPKLGPVVSVGSSGFVMQSADGAYALRIRGLLRLDSRWGFHDDDVIEDDSFLVRRARPAGVSA